MYLDSPDEKGGWMDSTFVSGLFDCLLAGRKDSQGPALRTGVERDMGVMDQQPHLVAPMRLTVFDKLPPPTPPAAGAQGFQWMAQTKNRLSRASARASTLTQKKTSRRPTISNPQPVILRLPSTGREKLRPLELSIHLPGNRLTDLPAFDRATFTDLGECRFPPKALLRTTSEQIIPTTAVVEAGPPKSVSMIERRMPQMHRTEHSSSISSGRTQSEYDPLHSHPVSWCSPLGMPLQIAMAEEPKSASILLESKAEEAATPPSVLVGDRSPSRRSFVELTSPSDVVSEQTGRKNSDVRHVEAGLCANYQSRKRVSQWLGHRANRSSTSTIKTALSSSTALSFAEHRRRRAQFYKLSATYAASPKPIALPFRYDDAQNHQRSMTMSAMQSLPETADSGSLLYDDDDDDDADDDIDSMTTGPTASEVQSRAGTIRSVRTPAGAKQPLLPVIVSGIPEVPDYVDGGVDGGDREGAIGYQKKQDSTRTGMGMGMVVTEINGVLQVPIGMAF